MAASEKERLRRRLKNLRRALKNAEEEAGKSDQAETTGQPTAASHDSAPTDPNSDPPSNTEQPHTAGNNPPEKKRKISLQRDSVFFPIAEIILAFAIMAATMAQAIIGKLQWDAMQTQNADTFRQAQLAQKATEQTDEVIEQMRLEQRAWIGVLKPTVDDLGSGKAISVTVPIRNTGHTPGNIIAIACSVTIHKAADLGEIGDGDSLETRVNRTFQAIEAGGDLAVIQTVIAPDGTGPWTFSGGEPITETTHNAIMDGTNIIFVYGGMNYTDTMDQVRRTRFCFFWHQDSKSLAAYHQYNEMK